MSFLTKAKGLKGFLLKIKFKKKKRKEVIRRNMGRRKPEKILGKPKLFCEVCGEPEIGSVAEKFVYARHPLKSSIKRHAATGIICSKCCNNLEVANAIAQSKNEETKKARQSRQAKKEAKAKGQTIEAAARK